MSPKPSSEEIVGIVTGNFAPFRIIVRDETDEWQPTLEQINSRDYDYVKLHRLSTFLDVGIAPFSLGMCFDGTLVLPATEEFRDRSAAMAIFNKLLSELLIGGLYCEAVTPDDIGYGQMSFTAYTRMLGGAHGPSASFAYASRMKCIGTLDVIRLLEPERLLVSQLQTALSRGKALLASLNEIPREQILYGITFFVRKQWAESLIHVWTTTERILEVAWQRYVVGSVNDISKKHRAFLDDHRTWPASTKVEMLHQKGLLPVSTYQKLQDTRKARNDLAHNGILPTHATAAKSIEGCFELASLCASEFRSATDFDHVVALAQERCNPALYPKKTTFKQDEVSHWLPIPPLPGDKEWGDKEYEIIEELCLKPIEPRA